VHSADPSAGVGDDIAYWRGVGNVISVEFPSLPGYTRRLLVWRNAPAKFSPGESEGAGDHQYNGSTNTCRVRHAARTFLP
jgi:hypothetical protein